MSGLLSENDPHGNPWPSARPHGLARFEQLGILAYESNITSDVDHDVEIERRVRAGELERVGP
jgi:hypothetical protein